MQPIAITANKDYLCKINTAYVAMWKFCVLSYETFRATRLRLRRPHRLIGVTILLPDLYMQSYIIYFAISSIKRKYISEKYKPYGYHI